MSVVVVSIHVMVCVLLILVVLLQAGKGTGMGAALGGSSQAFLDSGSASGILSKATTMAAIVFMLTSLTMGYMHGKSANSIMDIADIQKSQVVIAPDVPLINENCVSESILKEEKESIRDSSHAECDSATK